MVNGVVIKWMQGRWKWYISSWKAKEIKQKGNLLQGNSLCHKIKEKVEDLGLGQVRIRMILEILVAGNTGKSQLKQMVDPESTTIVFPGDRIWPHLARRKWSLFGSAIQLHSLGKDVPSILHVKKISLLLLESGVVLILGKKQNDRYTLQ